MFNPPPLPAPDTPPYLNATMRLKPCVGLAESGWTDLSREYWHPAATKQNTKIQRSCKRVKMSVYSDLLAIFSPHTTW